MENQLPLIDMNKEQVINIIKFIDSSQSTTTKEEIFSRLGNECLACGHMKEWVLSFNNDYQALINDVNKNKDTPYWKSNSPYWEKLELSEDKMTLYLTGKKVTRCACAFGNIADPPQSLCIHCCKSFQESLFGLLFGRKVEVEITESSILGGERCSTAIHLL